MSSEPTQKKAKTDDSTTTPVLRAIGFCGIDTSITVESLIEVSKEHPGIPEWGVLFRPEKEGEPRFPSMKWVETLCDAIKVEKEKDNSFEFNLAGHLCSTRCQEVLDGNFEFVQQLFQLGFKRVQVNATAANNVDSSTLDKAAPNVRSCIENVPEIEWIIQRNDETKPIWEHLLNADTPKNMSILFDDSVGRGVLCTEFTTPPENVKCGYAGGIGPKNVKTVLSGVSEAAKEVPVWIDMESSLRTIKEDKNDIFDLEKVKACILQAKEHGFVLA